ncbi:uncharacterized protein LOC124137186 [Haliotis rufescens]|uniref:uncharacterized protein LOC124137186 n=1 Tax=Haliotis rufescens TaxID=6454 RepID=UPI00201E8C23|nr:uncharacterized protein LOC124137186 [Haliotis rufescens]
MGTNSFAFWACLLFSMRCLHISTADTTMPEGGSSTTNQPDTSISGTTTSGSTDNSTLPLTTTPTSTSVQTSPSSTQRETPTDQTIMTSTTSKEEGPSTSPGDKTTAAPQITTPGVPQLVFIVAAASASAAAVIVSLVLLIVCCKITKHNISPNHENADVNRNKANKSRVRNSINSTIYEESDVARGHQGTDNRDMSPYNTNAHSNYREHLRQLQNRKKVSSAIYEESDVIRGHLGAEMREATPYKTDAASNLHSDHQLQSRTAAISTIYEASDVVRGHLGMEMSELPPYKPDVGSNSLFYIRHSGNRKDVTSTIYEAPDAVPGPTGLGTLPPPYGDTAFSSYSALRQPENKGAEHDYSKLHLYDAVTNEERLRESMQLGMYSDPRNLNI